MRLRIYSPQKREKRSKSESVGRINTMKCTSQARPSQAKNRNRLISCFCSVLCSRKKARSMENEKKSNWLQSRWSESETTELNMSTVWRFFLQLRSFVCFDGKLRPNDEKSQKKISKIQFVCVAGHLWHISAFQMNNFAMHLCARGTESAGRLFAKLKMLMQHF